MNKPVTINLKTEQTTRLIAELLAQESMRLEKKLIIYLNGNLGAGKTTLSQYFIKAFGVQDKIKSPTYTLIEQYHAQNKDILHLDLYRLASPEELSFLGIEDLLNQENIVFLIEWPEKGEGYLPGADIAINLSYDHNLRKAELIFNHNKFKNLCERLQDF